MHGRDTDTLSRDEIRSVLVEIHREDQILWSKWFHRGSTPAEKSGLYRYREGFDAAILNLAQRFRVTLRPAQLSPPALARTEKSTVISLEKIAVNPDDKGVYCLSCKEPLFRKGKRFWHCPVCEIDFRVVEEEG